VGPFVLLTVLLAAAAAPVRADVAGTAKVIDGDTIAINGERIRLHGIDAPETHQTCSAYGQAWACGQMATDWLKSHVARREVACVGHARDRYGRLLAVCYVGGESLNERIVREGWALDFRRYSTDYLAAEEDARRNGAGIWRGEFTAPWEWRRAQR
jgi:endonuclease YncB( thermonuclease family)